MELLIGTPHSVSSLLKLYCFPLSHKTKHTVCLCPKNGFRLSLANCPGYLFSSQIDEVQTDVKCSCPVTESEGMTWLTLSNRENAAQCGLVVKNWNQSFKNC